MLWVVVLNKTSYRETCESVEVSNCRAPYLKVRMSATHSWKCVQDLLRANANTVDQLKFATHRFDTTQWSHEWPG